jgi:DNA-binding MurR/RpiR family transcriptional regulator
VTEIVSPLQRVANVRPDLTDAKRRVADVLLNDATGVAKASISWVADKASTTPATVSRFAVELGYTGFAELRSAIATDNGRAAQLRWEDDIGLEFGPTDDAKQVVDVLAKRQLMAMRNALSTIDFEVLTLIADRMAHAPHVHLFGRGGDEILAKELHVRLLRIGVPAWLGVAAIDLGDNLLTAEDIVVVFSRSGDDADAQVLLNRAHERKAMTVVITGETSSKLARSAEVLLYTGTRHGIYWTEYYAGRASDGLAASALWVLVAQRVARDSTANPDILWPAP